MALCLLQTLRAIARERAPGLTPRQIIEKFRTVRMVDVVMPTTDGGTVTLPRHVEPKQNVAILLDRLGLTLPVQPSPKISGDLVETGNGKNGSVVKTSDPNPCKRCGFHSNVESRVI